MDRRLIPLPFRRQARAPAAATASSGRVNVYMRSIADRFGIFVSGRAEGWLPKIHSESELPYPKVIIQDALRAAIASAHDDAERSRWTSCLVALEHFLPDRELEPYSAALEHERECIRLMGRANLEHHLDHPNGLSPERLASYERHVAGAAALRPLLDRVALAAERATREAQH